LGVTSGQRRSDFSPPLETVVFSRTSKIIVGEATALLLRITPEERATLQLLADGKDSSQIARGLGLSNPEAERRLTTLFSKMGARTDTEAIAAALRRGLLVQ
jgi:DNA-binding NarL/FixJ family response regulator